jgi:hypothetical protein
MRAGPQPATIQDRSKEKAMTDTALFTSEEHVNATIGEYKTRLAAVRQAVDEYHQHCQRRYATDEYHQTAARLRGAAGFLAGDYDGTYPGDYSHVSFGGLGNWRVHYADDSLRAALHHLVWAEHYAGLRTREDARAADPYSH